MGLLTIERLDATLGARSDDEQKAFGRPFGPLEDISGTQGLTPISNARTDRTLRRADDMVMGDLVVWDNRCVLHRARPWSLEALRVMKHTRVSGDPVTEGAAA